MDEREKNADLIRFAIANGDTDDIDRFMSQYSKAAVCEWLVAQMAPEPRKLFLQALLTTYQAELNSRVPS